MTNVRASGVKGSPSALPDGWELRCGSLIGQTADLSRADLRNCDMSNIDLTGVKFKTSAGSAQLSGIKSGLVTGQQIVLPSGWAIVKGFIAGPAAALTGADLSSVNLAAASFKGLSLAGANLTLAKLTGSDLATTSLAGATLAKATITRAVLARTVLTGIKSSALVGAPKSLPKGWKLVRGALLAG
jgi:uncharacterized protein YjbI with pentapeptide repeats